MRRCSLLLALLLPACGGRVLDDAGSGNAGVAGDESQPDSGSSSAPPSSSGGGSPSDAAPVVTDGSPPITPACNDALWGAGHPEAFRKYEFVHTPSDCSPNESGCFVVPRIFADCTMELQNRNELGKFTLSANDCAFVKRMATSEPLVKVMRASYACTGKSGPNDTISVDLATESLAVKFESTCVESPIGEHRACVQWLLERYSPGIRL